MGRWTLCGRRKCVAGAAVVLMVVTMLLLCACGAGAAGGSSITPGAPSASGSSSTTVPADTSAPAATTSGAPVPAPSTSETDAPTGSTPESIVLEPPVGKQDVFARIAAAMKPLPIFAPTGLPDGAELAPRWLPVLESENPETSSAAGANPLIVGSGADAEVQVIYQMGTVSAWLVVIENFHGDLGDVSGTDVGTVDGIPARLYEVNGGELVQWSLDGRWYGVFGRGVSKDVILATALGMVQASAESL